MRISYTKAHGTKNDFLLSWTSEAPQQRLEEVARAICDRHTGIGADGWMLVSLAEEGAEYDAKIRLFNADGSYAELSGNGTRCAAAFLMEPSLVASPVRMMTQAGMRELRLVGRQGLHFMFEMGMGRPSWRAEDVRFQLPLEEGGREVTVLETGNPQCAVFAEGLDFDWQRIGAEIEGHPHFPNRTNVSFVQVLDRHTLNVLFYERGAGPTMSSGTGSTGAVWAAMLRGLVDSPVRVLTPGGPLEVRWDEAVYMTGPAEIVGRGEYYFE